MKKSKKILKWTGLGLLVLIILAEIGLRLFWSDELYIKPRVEDVFENDPVIIYQYKSNTYINVGEEKIKVNRDGFIGEDIGPKSPDKFRIAFVGSCGVSGSVHLSEYYSFCPMLQQLFSDNHYNVEILNCGIEGNDRTLEQFLSIEYKVLALEPDIIIMESSLPILTLYTQREYYRDYQISFPDSDFEGQARLKGMVDNLYDNEWWIKPICASYIVRGCFRFYANRTSNITSAHIQLYQSKRRISGKFRHVRYTVDESVEMITSLKQRLQEQNISLFMFDYTRNPEFYAFAKEKGLPLIPLNLDFEKQDYFPKDITHWNGKGCQKIADRLYEIITKNNLVPEQFSQVNL